MTKIPFTFGRGGFLQVGGVRVQALEGAQGEVLDDALHVNGLMITFEDPLLKEAFRLTIERIQRATRDGTGAVTLDFGGSA
jgi:hypothetical protein